MWGEAGPLQTGGQVAPGNLETRAPNLALPLPQKGNPRPEFWGKMVPRFRAPKQDHFLVVL